MGSTKLGNLSAKIGQYLPSSKNGDSHAGVSDMPDNQPEPAGPNGTCIVTDGKPHGSSTAPMMD